MKLNKTNAKGDTVVVPYLSHILHSALNQTIIVLLDPGPDGPATSDISVAISCHQVASRQ